MPINRTPSSSFGFLVKSKTFVVACLLSSAAMITEPQVAHARNGVNGFMAGAILGGAMRGIAPPGTRGYRGSRTYRRSGTTSRDTRSRSKPEKETEAKQEPGGEKVFGTSQVPAAAAGGAAVTGAAASSGGGSSAAASTGSSAAASETAGSSGRSSGRSGRSGGLQTTKDGLD